MHITSLPHVDTSLEPSIGVIVVYIKYMMKPNGHYYLADDIIVAVM
jgi:hypothetical protein